MFAYNCRQVLLTALHSEHDQQDVESMSPHRVALDIVRPLVGMLTAINESEWQSLTPATLNGKSNFLRHVAKQVDVVAYRKSVRGPKKKPRKRKRCKNSAHVSTAKLIESQVQTC